eukprot:5259836-Amphidinium_carterae.1
MSHFKPTFSKSGDTDSKYGSSAKWDPSDPARRQAEPIHSESFAFPMNLEDLNTLCVVMQPCRVRVWQFCQLHREVPSEGANTL